MSVDATSATNVEYEAVAYGCFDEDMNECIEWPDSWASVETSSQAPLKFSSWYGCTP